MSILATEIRPARIADAASLADVHEASWRGAYAGLLPHRRLDRMIGRRRTDWWAGAIRTGAPILVVDFGGSSVGYATYGRNRAAGAIPAEGEIFELYMKPEYQGLGFGARLFEAVRAELGARRLKGVVVWALAENGQACSFYERRGGTAVAEGFETFDDRQIAKIAFVWP